MTIIAAVDLSSPSINAARSAGALCRKLGDKLLLLRVIEPISALYPELMAAGVPDLDVPLRKANVEALENIRVSLAGEADEIDTRVLAGKPAAVLASCAQEERARLIVVGTRGRGPLADLFLGSVAQRTVLQSPCPVLVVRDGKAPFEEWLAGKRALRVVVGIDRTPASDGALAWVSALRNVGPCEVVMVHEYWPPAEHARLGVHGPRDLREPDAAVVATLEREILAYVETLPGQGQVSLRVRPSWARAGDSLAQDAEREHADLLVVGTHQPHGLERLRSGSAAVAAVQASSTPVLCVPTVARAA